MPHYDYECQKCGYVFEVFQRITDGPVKECPKCKGRVKKLIGAGAGLIFKGSGFYITDYKKNNGKQNTSSQKSHHKKSESNSASSGKKNNNTSSDAAK